MAGVKSLTASAVAILRLMCNESSTALRDEAGPMSRPRLLAMCAVLGIIDFVPGISLRLPDLIMGP